MLRSARSFMSTTRRQHDPPRVDAQLVAVVEVVVEHGRQQVVGQLDGVEVAGEMEVDVLHRHDLGVAAAGGAALHAETRSQRRLAQADGRPLADPVQAVAQPDARGGLAFAGGRRRDGRHQHQLAGRRRRPCGGRGRARLRLVFAVVLQVVVADAKLGGDLRRSAASSRVGRFQCRAAASGRCRTLEGVRGQGSGRSDKHKKAACSFARQHHHRLSSIEFPHAHQHVESA